MSRRSLRFMLLAVLAACGGGDPENQAPVAVEDRVTVPEDAPVAIGVLANDRDPDGDPLALVRASAVGHAVRVDGEVVRVDSEPDFHGEIVVTYVVSDGDRSATGRAIVTVTPVNDAPVARAAEVITGRATPVAIRLEGDDVDGDVLTFAVERGPGGGTLSGTAPELLYTPNGGFAGPDAITFRAGDGASWSEPATIDITVVAGQPPVAQAQAIETPVDTSVAITLGATDPDGDALAFTVVEPPAHGTLTGTPPVLTYTPAPGFVGADLLRFTATDGLLTSAPALVTIAVGELDTTPVAHAQTVTLSEDIPRMILLAGTSPTGAPLSYLVVEGPREGVLSGAGSARVYTPRENFFGHDSFTFVVSSGGVTSPPATVSLEVEPVPDAPVATAQSVQATEDVPRSITLAGTDADGDALTFAVTAGPTHGALAGTAPALTYTPAENYFGPDAITFTVSDGMHTSSAITIPITVGPVDDAPVLVGRAFEGEEGAYIAIPLPATDVDGEPLTYTVATPPAHGGIYGAGAARQYMSANHVGTDVFALQASDGHTTTAPATFTVTLTPTPDAPTARDDLGIATPGQALRLDVLANDDDVDGEPLVLDGASAPAHGTVDIDGDELVYTPDPGNPARDTFTYTVADPTGLTATATVTIGIGELPSGLATRNVGRVVYAPNSWNQFLQHDLSADGRYTAMLSLMSLTPGDTNGVNDVYVYDRLTDTFERVSVAADGGQADGASERPSISADGRFVAFASAATNLVPGDTNGAVDVFVRDRQTGTTVRASVGASGLQVTGTSREPELSADGTVVAFLSTSFELVADDANGAADVFVRDLTAGTTTRVSVRTGGGEADLASSQPVLSGDGRVVAFTSAASNLVTGDTNGQADVFVHDRTSGVTERVSVSSTGAEANSYSAGASLSYDGRFVAFGTAATNLVPGVNGNATLVRDRQAITTTLGADPSSFFSLSGDGRYLVGARSDGACYVRDRFAGLTQWLSLSGGSDLFFPVLSRNGRYIGVLSNATLAPGAAGGTRLYLYANPL